MSDQLILLLDKPFVLSRLPTTARAPLAVINDWCNCFCNCRAALKSTLTSVCCTKRDREHLNLLFSQVVGGWWSTLFFFFCFLLVGDGLVQPEALNKKAIQIINRVRDKLTGEFCSSLKHQPLTQKGSKHERKQLYYYYRNEVGIVKLPQVRCFWFFFPWTHHSKKTAQILYCKRFIQLVRCSERSLVQDLFCGQKLSNNPKNYLGVPDWTPWKQRASPDWTLRPRSIVSDASLSPPPRRSRLLSRRDAGRANASGAPHQASHLAREPVPVLHRMVSANENRQQQ